MRLKHQLSKPSGAVEMRGINLATKAVVTSKEFFYVARDVNLDFIDLREVSATLAALTHTNMFMAFLFQKLEPKMTEPSVWLFILENMDDVKVVTSFDALTLKEYDVITSIYILAKAECLNNVTSLSTSTNVLLLFLFKKENDFSTSVHDKVKKEYKVPFDYVYYADPARNTKAKWRISPRELRMEFYLNMLEDFMTPQQNVFGIYAGPKCMLVAKVCCHIVLSLCRQ